MANRRRALQPRRSPKAGRPPERLVSPPWVRRRQKTAHVQVRKGTTLWETGHGPRVLRGVRTPKVKKR